MRTAAMAAALLGSALLGLGVPCPARAQAPVKHFDELAALLKPGSTIWVTDAQGREVKGQVIECKPSHLVLNSHGPLTLDADAVRQIKKRGRRPVLLSAGIGAAIGMVAAMPAAFREEGDCSWSLDPMMTSCPGDGYLIAGALIGGAFGAGLGAMIPGKRQIVYQAPGATGSPRLALVPVIAPRVTGVAASWSF